MSVASASRSVITTRALVAGYGGVAVTSLPDLSIAPGDRVLIRGANGSGKTTVLKTLARLLPPVSGRVEGVPAGPGGAVYVHPSPYLFAGTGYDNVVLGAHGARDAADHAIAALGAAAFAASDVRALSNGQRQRIALARALAARPAVLLIDEADTGLDAGGLAAWRALLAGDETLAVIVASPGAVSAEQDARDFGRRLQRVDLDDARVR